MSHLLVEIGTEELPVDSLDVIYSDLEDKDSVNRNVFKDKIKALLGVYRLSYKTIFAGATPRRIAFFVEDLASRQENQHLEFNGPAVEKAYDADGNPTPALLGFLKSKSADLKDVKIKETSKGKFVILEKKEIGKPAIAVLPHFLEAVLNAPAFPKTMRWEKSGFKFPRPVRWILALLDRKVIPFQVAGIKASHLSYGHRFLAPKAFKIPSADWAAYQKALKKMHVILKLEERKAVIRRALLKKYHQGSFDQELVHTAANLVEEPFLLEGSFSKSYLELPSEVLASCMKKNQKIFACCDSKARLTSRFMAVLNGKRKNLSRIRAGYENVLDSRLKDARYFFQEDTKEPLEAKLPLLEQIVYLGKLGTMREKTERLERLAGDFAVLVGRADLKESLQRAARLSKIDLMTRLVYEFPELQGVVGREYALASGEKDEVASAIGTQYLPKNLSEDFRELKKQLSPVGALFGLLDRLDLLVGAFGTGLEPTGSQDPFALRRAGGAAVKIWRALRFPFKLSEAIRMVQEQYARSAGISKGPELESRLKKFFEERVTFELQAKAGTRESEILTAVFRSSFDNLADVYDRYEALTQLYERDSEAFIRTAKVVERTGNILKGAKVVSGIDPSHFRENSEIKLYQILNEHSGEITTFLEKKDYAKATSRFGEIFHQPVHDFFKEVMVNVEDPALRSTRQALVSQINRLYTERLADLSVLSRLEG